MRHRSPAQLPGRRHEDAAGFTPDAEELPGLAREARFERRARVRLGVGAGVVVLLAALSITVAVSAFVPRGSAHDVIPARGSVSSTTPPRGPTDPARLGAVSEPAARSAAIMFVHVLGAVERPGLYELRQGARLIDAVSAAGGVTAEADPAGVNLARLVTDGEQITVRRVGEARMPEAPDSAGAGAGTGAGGSAGGALVNLNSASVAQLQSLPRIGPALAQRIIDWRTANGCFAAVADLLKVAGIGQTLFDGVKSRVTV